MSKASPPTVHVGKLNDRGLLAAIGTSMIVLLVYTHVASIVTSKLGISSTPMYIVVFVLGAIIATGLVPRRKLPPVSWQIILLILIYVIILIISVMLSRPSDQVLDLFKDRLYWASFTIASLFVISSNRDAKYFLLLFRLAVAFSAAVVLLEFASQFDLPIQLTTVRGRAAGLFENPNITAIFLACAVPIVTIGLRFRGRLLWYVAIATCVFLTFSRGGLILCGVATFMVEAFPIDGRGKSNLRRLFLLGLFVIIAVGLYGLAATFLVTEFGSNLTANTLARVRLETDLASDARFYALQLSWDGFATSPFWGHGIGAGDRWQVIGMSTHNMFALVAVEQGILGLAWICAFLVSLLAIRAPYGLWLFWLFVVGGMFNHNLFDRPTYGIILAVYASLPVIFGAVQSGPANAPTRPSHPPARVYRGGPRNVHR